ncbi:MAG TPA: type II secretion system protein GspJ [Kofleriaceae bacterium]|nr:type II secretion system protein GspJ [Kofleriaceae bacterium]
MQPSAHNEHGFTLVEVMIALAILAFMMTVAWSTTARTADAKVAFEDIQVRNNELRVAMARMTRDIESAYLSDNEVQRATRERTLFVGSDEGDIDSLRFSSLGHTVLWADANECEQSLVAYYAAPDSEDRGKKNLIRHETRRLSEKPWKQRPAAIDILIRDVEGVKLEYYDERDKQWKPEWDTMSASAQKGRMPTRVRITVTIQSRGGKDIELTTEARIMLREELQFIAN